ncbi:MAG: Dabb family protein [Lachnospiraceae bacterium]
MLHHYVLFKYKPGFLTDEVVRKLRDGFALIRAEVPGVRSVVIDTNVVDRPANMDLMIRMALDDDSVLDAYLHHPEHLRLGEEMNPFITERVSFDSQV